MKYIVSAYKFHKEFASKADARACFESVKRNFNYCELKAAVEGNYYYAESIEIFRQ